MKKSLLMVLGFPWLLAACTSNGSAPTSAPNEALRTQIPESAQWSTTVQILTARDLPQQGDDKGWTEVVSGAWTLDQDLGKIGATSTRYASGETLEGIQWMLDQALADQAAAPIQSQTIDENSWIKGLRKRVANFDALKATAARVCSPVVGIGPNTDPSGYVGVVAYGASTCTGYTNVFNQGPGSASSGARYNDMRVIGAQTQLVDGEQAYAYATMNTTTPFPSTTQDCARVRTDTTSGGILDRTWGTAVTSAYACPTF